MLYHITLDTNKDWTEQRPLCGTVDDMILGNHLWGTPDRWGQPIHESYTRCIDCMLHPDFPTSQIDRGLFLLAEVL